ncbi:hypothetical protein ACTWQF_30080 [Streptomyces sp. 8N114]|uniref:hypothetical protein n=1 Tax=Streptomyces sp. 8N114 TaxID=3457419 RepID=UPI003FD48434
MRSGPSGARYYRVDCENGITVDDPSEDSLVMLIGDLDEVDNTFLVLQPDGGSDSWFATVAVLEEGGYDVVRRDPDRGEHEVTTETSAARIAQELTIWAARRFHPSPRA